MFGPLRRLPTRALPYAAFVAVLLAPQAAESFQPVKDSGRIGFGPGWRHEFLRGSDSLGGAIRFGWHARANVFLGLEGAFWSGGVDVDNLGLDNSTIEDVTMMVGDVRLFCAAHLLSMGPATLYGVGGGGYHVVGVSVDGSYVDEVATQGLFAGFGLTLSLTERLGLFIEDRYTFLTGIQAEIGGESPTLDAGGNLLWVGLVLLFEPQPRPTGLGN